MPLITANHVNIISDTVDNSVPFTDADEQALLNQSGADVTLRIRVEVLVDAFGQDAGGMPTALIAYDAYGHQLRESTHLVALPCPPYCDNKGG